MLQCKEKVIPVKQLNHVQKRMLLLLLLLASIAIVATIYFFHVSDTQASQPLLTFIKQREVEYGTDCQAEQFIAEADGTLQEMPTIHTQQLGKQKLIYKIKKGTMLKEYPLVINIRDTQAPIIKLKQEKVIIHVDETFTLMNNLTAVQDPVDGKLQYQKNGKEPEKGYYTIKGEVDSSTAGLSTVEVWAKDRNGNITKKAFHVEVLNDDKKTATEHKKPQEKTPQQPKASKPQPTYIKGILLVNRQHPLPKTFGGSNAKANAALQKLQQAAAEKGYAMELISGYRSYEYQKELYANYVKRDGQAAADRYSAKPGTSEHQSGLAFDVGAIDEAFQDTKSGKWLAKHCATYGFILRYPKGKEAITGYMYEPWHIRYVGEEPAKAIMEQHLTLEEYLGAI